MASDMSYGMVGTGTAAESAADTTLSSAVTATSSVVTKSTSDRQVVIDYSLGASAAVGSAITEFGVFGIAGTLYSRHLFASLSKSSTEQWQISVAYNFG